MKILHITDGIPPVVLGGTCRMVLEIAKGQREHGHEIGILSAAKSGELPPSQDGISLLTITPRSERFAHYRCVFSVSREQEVMEHIQKFKPEIIHAHTISRQAGYRWIPKAKAEGIKVIITCHDVSHVAYGKVTGFEKNMWLRDLFRYKWSFNPLRNILIKKFLRSADTILAVSDALKEYLETRGISSVETVHNGIDLGFWKPSVSQGAARETLKLPADRFLFLLAGRMGVDKGSLLVSATFPKNADLVLAGDRFSDEFAPVKDRMHIFYHQNPEEMKLHYAAADAVLVPSKCLDCFPTVCLEAMAMERAVLATSWGGAKESVQDGVTGWILDPLNEETWREQMEWCIAHRQEVEKFGKEGRRRMEQEFSLEKMLNRLEQAYI